VKGLAYAYRDRKDKNGTVSRVMDQRINAGVRLHGMSYSLFIGGLEKKGISLTARPWLIWR
jgi:large subunit ribosomal protein L20